MALHGSGGATGSPATGQHTLDTYLLRALEEPGFADALADAAARRELITTLVEIRKTLALTQARIAHAMDVSQATVSEFEIQSTDPHLSTVQRYARTLGYRVDAVVVPALAPRQSHFPVCLEPQADTIERFRRALASRPDRVDRQWVESAQTRRSDFAQAC